MVKDKTAEMANPSQRVDWNKDGSMKVLLDILTTEGNWEHFHGGGHHGGRTKDSYYSEWSQKISSTQGTTYRSPKDVCCKISRLQSQYKTAYDWKNCTGQGLMEGGSDIETINTYLRKLCPYFDELNPIMEDKASTKPLYSNEDSDIDTDSDSSSGEDDTSQQGTGTCTAQMVSQTSAQMVSETVSSLSLSQTIFSLSLLLSQTLFSSPVRNGNENVEVLRSGNENIEVSTPDSRSHSRSGSPATNATNASASDITESAPESEKRRLSLKKKRKKRKTTNKTTNLQTLDHNSFMEANVAAREREVDALVKLKTAETKVAEARAKREDIEVTFSLLQKRKDLENQGVEQALIDRLLPLPL
jgi:hypothetical protein